MLRSESILYCFFKIKIYTYTYAYLQFVVWTGVISRSRKTVERLRWVMRDALTGDTPKTINRKKNYIIYLPSFTDHSLQESILKYIHACSRSTQVVAHGVYINTNKADPISLCAPTDNVTIGSCISTHGWNWHVTYLWKRNGSTSSPKEELTCDASQNFRII
jgi:hypothetical protein